MSDSTFGVGCTEAINTLGIDAEGQMTLNGVPIPTGSLASPIFVDLTLPSNTSE